MRNKYEEPVRCEVNESMQGNHVLHKQSASRHGDSSDDSLLVMLRKNELDMVVLSILRMRSNGNVLLYAKRSCIRFIYSGYLHPSSYLNLALVHAVRPFKEQRALGVAFFFYKQPGHVREQPFN